MLKNKDINILCDIEELLHKYIKNDNTKEREKNYDLWIDYWNIVENIIQVKKQASKKSNDYNKRNRERHRYTNNLYNARKNNDIKKIEYYTKKIKELNNKK